MDLVRLGWTTHQLSELAGPLKERQRVGQELPALLGEGGSPARPAVLAVELDAEPFLESQQPIAYTLFRDVQDSGRAAQAPLASQLDQCRHLVGRE